MAKYRLSFLEQLESEAIYVIGEAAAQFENSVILFSGGKDSLVISHLARKAFYPNIPPMPLLHIDTGHNFPETLQFRDQLVEDTGYKLIVRNVQDTIDQGKAQEDSKTNSTRNHLQSITLLDAIEEHKFDAAIGGARRDEEKARAKERFFSHRDAFGQWQPKQQRPELWQLYNGRKNPDEHFRVFPISNWTELDVWHYIEKEKLNIPSLYFSHKRNVIVRDGVILAESEFIEPITDKGEEIVEMQVRFRTIGDLTVTGAVESNASTISEIIDEVATTHSAERGGRADDKRSKTAMEDRKKQGYF